MASSSLRHRLIDTSLASLFHFSQGELRVLTPPLFARVGHSRNSRGSDEAVVPSLSTLGGLAQEQASKMPPIVDFEAEETLGVYLEKWGKFLIAFRSSIYHSGY